MDLNCYFEQWQCSPQLDKKTFTQIRRHLALKCFKWDAQIGDVSTLAPFALILPMLVWQQLATLAEKLTSEANTAELQILQRPELMKQLGLPRQIVKILSEKSVQPSPPAARVVRFDFHPTSDGWRISEANYDVPGGYTEASNFSKLMVQQFPGTTLAGNPANKLVDALTHLFDNRSVVFITDFPSVNFFTEQRINSVIVVRQSDRKFASDLTYILNTWQKANLSLSYKPLSDPRPIQPLKIWAFPWLGIWVRLIANLTLHKHSNGGFGGFIPSSSSG